MAKDYSTALSRVRRHGAAHEGVGHFVGQRVSAVALAVLSPLMLLAVLFSANADGGVTGMLSSGWGSILAILFFSAAFYHMRLGLQVVVEDYIQGAGLRITLLLASTFLALGLWVAVSVSILKLALGG